MSSVSSDSSDESMLSNIDVLVPNSSRDTDAQPAVMPDDEESDQDTVSSDSTRASMLSNIVVRVPNTSNHSELPQELASSPSNEDQDCIGSDEDAANEPIGSDDGTRYYTAHSREQAGNDEFDSDEDAEHDSISSQEEARYNAILFQQQVEHPVEHPMIGVEEDAEHESIDSQEQARLDEMQYPMFEPSPPQEDTMATMLAEILAIPVRDAKKPKGPSYLDCDPCKKIRDMDPPRQDSSTDAELIVSLIQNEIIEDDGYMWADATELQRWLNEELTKRLNHFLDAEAREVSPGVLIPVPIREIRGTTPGIVALARWCRRDGQRRANFRSWKHHIDRLRQFDMEKDLSLCEIMTLIIEAKDRVENKPSFAAHRATVADTISWIQNQSQLSGEDADDEKGAIDSEPMEIDNGFSTPALAPAPAPASGQRITRAALRKRATASASYGAPGPSGRK